jgi:site-specific recombinase XerD
VLTAEEEEQFFRVAAGNPDWNVAYWAVSLTNNTSAKGTELRLLQIKHLKLDQETPTIHIPDGSVKNELGARVVPLNHVAEKQIRRILKRAHALGAWSPEHYVFPYRMKKNIYDVTRPASPNFLRTAFRSMRRATGMEWLQPRNFRNQVITKLFEKGTPQETIISIAGHQSLKMSRYYSLLKISAKAEALRAICPQPRNSA